MREHTRDRFDSFLKRNRGRLGHVIHDLWESRDAALWSKDPYFFLRLGERADSLGQSMFAHDILKEGLRVFPGHLALTQRYCLSLITCGFLLTARDLASRLVKEGHADEETLGILARVYKEMWLIEGDGAANHPHLAKSRALYLDAFQRSRGHWPGINAASLSLIMADRDLSRKTARQVLRICADRLKTPANRDYWTLATVAEAFLVLGRQEQAARFYRSARARSDRSYSSLASSRRQLLLLARYTVVDPGVLDELRMPPVIAFTGHMIDDPDQEHAHFPQSRAADVKSRIAALLKRLDARIGYASAACGSDLLFHECLLARDGEANVVLPFDRKEFLQISVRFAGPAWMRRAQTVLARARVEQATQGGYGGDDLLFSYANRLIMGKAILRSRFLATEPLLVAVWDGERNGKPGGTSECVELWEKTGFPSVVIDPTEARVRTVSREPPGRPSRARSVARRTGPGGSRQIMAILFADMVGYSRMAEEQVPAYVTGFLNAVSGTLRSAGAQPLYKNTWGDAICLAFEDPLQAADCAISIRDMVRGTNWKRLNLPHTLSIRIGLHAGPVYCIREPLLGRLNVFGFHVNQAARIEPITSPGNVYASESFAALLLADPCNGLDCRYVGDIMLPKDFGRYAIYHIKRRTEVG